MNPFISKNFPYCQANFSYLQVENHPNHQLPHFLKLFHELLNARLLSNQLKVSNYNLEMKIIDNNIIEKKNKENKYIQLEISNIHNNTEYSWELSNIINNVIGIKLLSYSIPQSKYNIENYNNLLIINNHKLEIPIGNYTINDLLNYINNHNNYIRMELDINQHINIISNFEDETFIIDSTTLLKYNLGFSLDKYENEIDIKSDNIWDLRLNNKVYLYFTNLSDDIPISILNYKGESSGEFNFEDNFNLNKIDILFKDQNKNKISFYNLPHYISLLLIINN